MLNARHLLCVGVIGTVCISPAAAEAATTYSLSGSFSDNFAPGDSSTSSIVENLVNGSFSGSYSVEGGLPPAGPNGDLSLSSFLVTLFQKDGFTALTTFSSDNGDFGGIFDDSDADLLNFANSDGLLQLVFNDGFNGSASTEPLIGFSSTGFAVFGNEFEGSIDASGESQQVPTPALLPGLMGISASLWKRKKDEKKKATVT